MLTEETHSQGVADDKIASHESAAHEKRNWVRLTFDCNNRCVFCLDSDTHDGEIRDRESIKQQILDGRRKGATRLILSGGEPTIHPQYVDFIRLGARAGYTKIQTVTNGRLFSYPDFLARCLDAGLSEITFSLHGPNARIHDALVGVKGAFEQEVAGLRAALADGRPVVNIDVVINRANVQKLGEMLRLFYGMGVREFDLLQVVPFGRAFTEGRDTLFYDLEAMRPHLLEALEFSRRPDVHVWLNRFPPQHLEGYEHLIQDPYKLNDEIRGRKEEFARLLDQGTPLDCREPSRCRYCYLERVCDTLDEVRATVARHTFRVVRVDTEWEARQAPVFGGDPASSRRARVALPIVQSGAPGAAADTARAGTAAPEALSLEALVAASGADTLRVCAPDVSRAAQAVAGHPGLGFVELELADYTGLASALTPRDDGGCALGHARVTRAYVADAAQAEALLALPYDFEVVLALASPNASWLHARAADPPARLALYQPTYERLTEARERDLDLRAFFREFTSARVPVEGVPACVTGRAPRASAPTLDTAMLTPAGRLEIFRYIQRFILAHYQTRSLRCRGCAHEQGCPGMHVNYVRAHGYGVMQPVSTA